MNDWDRSRQRTPLLFFLVWGVCFLDTAAAALTADHDSECGPLISFFPDGQEDTNIPMAWGRTAQMAAGNYAKDVMFTIAMPSIVNIAGTDAYSKPVLQVQAVHDLMSVGNTGIPRQCMGYDDPGRRKLLQHANSTGVADKGSGGSRSNSNGTNAAPTSKAADAQGQLYKRVSEQQNSTDSANTLLQHDAEQSTSQGITRVQQQEQEPQLALLYPARFKVQYQLNNSAVVDIGEYSDTRHPPKIVLDLANYPDDYYCVAVQVTILPWTGLMMPGSVAVPVKPLVSTKQVCFYKIDGLPTAQARFNTCSAESFSIAVSDIHPFPVPLYPGSDEPFWYPVAHFTTELNRTGDYHWPPNNAKTSLEQWIIAADTTKPFVWTPVDQLYDGWYNIHLAVSLTTPYPSLMAVGLDRVATYNESKAPEVIQGWYKYLDTPQYPAGTVFGIQHQLSRYRSMEGPELAATTIPLHTEVPFTWEFDGFGDTYCYVDGKLQHNWGVDQCTPPFNVAVHDRQNHTIKVVRKDVCGNSLTVVSTFGAWGYALTKVPKDVGEELAASEGYADNPGLIFESAPLQPTTLKKKVPHKVQGNNGTLLRVPNMQLGCIIMSLLLLLQLT